MLLQHVTIRKDNRTSARNGQRRRNHGRRIHWFEQRFSME